MTFLLFYGNKTVISHRHHSTKRGGGAGAGSSGTTTHGPDARCKRRNSSSLYSSIFCGELLLQTFYGRAAPGM